MNSENHLLLFIDLVLKSAAVFLLAALATRIWRSASAANRHMVWLAAFVMLLLLPFTKFTTPRWAFDPVSNRLLPGVQGVATPGEPHTPAMSSSGQHAGRYLLKSGVGNAVTALWLGGALLLLAYRITGSFQLRHLMKQSSVVESGCAWRLALQIADANGIAAELRKSDNIRVPMTWGMHRAVIVLPSQAVEWSDEHLASALLHEFGHVRRRDCLTRLFAQITCAIYWVNPLVWMGARELRLAQELACDDLVLNSGMSGAEYASQLVNIVRSLQPVHFPSRMALAMAHRSTLKTRVAAIVDPLRNRRPLTRIAIVISIAAIVILLPLFTMAQMKPAGRIVSRQTGYPDKMKSTTPKFGDQPVDIDADDTKFENHIAVSRGHAVLRYGKLAIKADIMRYYPENHVAKASGHIQFTRDEKNGGSVLRGEDITYNVETRELTIDGKTVNASE